MPMKTPEQQEWYADGLRFACTQCGNCCTGPQGVVWFSDEEGEAIAAFLGITKVDLLQRYAQRIGGRWSLGEVHTEHGYDCVFLRRDPATGKAGCGIYGVRPTQCRTWPFWTDNLKSPRHWQRAAKNCPGIAAGNDGRGRLYPIEHIRIERDRTPD